MTGFSAPPDCSNDRRRQKKSDDLRTLLRSPHFADVGDLGDWALPLHRPGVEQQRLVFILVHQPLHFFDEPQAFARIELTAEDRVLDAIPPSAQELEDAGAAAVVDDVVGNEVEASHAGVLSAGGDARVGGDLAAQRLGEQLRLDADHRPP